jgi:putative ABC transport system permease protein
MIRNYLKVALRSLLKQRVYSIINITGLSVGIASCLLITMFVLNEFSYDRFHENGDNIYKIALARKYPNHVTNYAIIPHSYSDVIQRDFPEVVRTLKIGGPFNDVLVQYITEKNEPVQFEEDYIMSADSNFFQLFSIKLIKGEPDNVLTNVTDLVITESTAMRYFGSDDPIGKTMKFFNQDFTVKGISEDVPDNSHLKFDFLIKWDDNFFGGQESNFVSFSAHIYVELNPGADPDALESKFPKMVDTYAAAQIERELGKSWEDYKKEGNGYTYTLQPLRSIHLDPTNIEAKMRPGGNINYVYFLICIASLILLIACINFMNLATARSAERAREVGVRKTMGSMKAQLVLQFLVESIVLSLFSTMVAIGLAQLSLPAFNELAGKQLAFAFTPSFVLGIVGTALVVGFLAGSYPAFALSSFNPVVVMKGNFTGSSRGAWLRNGLVVFQFFISIILIVGTLIVGNQMRYMQNKSLGYNKDQLIVVDRVFALQDRAQTFIDEIKRIPGVSGAASAFSLLGRQGDFFGAQFLPEGSDEILTTKSMAVDDDFAEMIGFEIVAGRAFSKETSDSLSIMLNETAVRTLDIADPVGKKLRQIQRTANGSVEVTFEIVGVIRDFNFQSLRDPVTPLTIQSNETFGGGAGYAFARVNGESMTSCVEGIEAAWKELLPDQPFKYSFMDQELADLYEAEKKAGQVFGVFSALAIVIACVGLFGLAAYTANLRTKEIGIRKVLGASVFSVFLLLSRDFTKLIVVAFVLSIPTSWYIMNQWLEGFAYRINVGISAFAIAGIAVILIAWITVSYQSIRAAIVNPVNSLRSE